MPEAISYDGTWTLEAQQICNRAIARHGGSTAWNQFDSVMLKPISLGGLLPYFKGYRKTFTLPTYFEVYPKTRRVVFYEFPRAGEVAEFSRGDLKIVLSNKGAVDTIKQARTKYRGLAKIKPWHPIDCLYFFGYAWTTYISWTFVFPTFKFLRSFRHHEKGEQWDAFIVKIPSDFDAHCKQQTFYFDQSGLLRRNETIMRRLSADGPWLLITPRTMP
jgi:hypothetical protein